MITHLLTPIQRRARLNPERVHLNITFSLQLLHGGGFAGSVVTKKRGDLPLVELQVEMVDGKFPSLLVDLYQISDVHTQIHVSGFWLDVI